MVRMSKGCDVPPPRDMDCFNRKPRSRKEMAELIHATVDSETFRKLAREYAGMIDCTIDERELGNVVRRKEGQKNDAFYCPCIPMKEKVFVCPCDGRPDHPTNKGRLRDIEEKGHCYCKLYFKKGYVPPPKKVEETGIFPVKIDVGS